jgi:glycosyltransferase involved in cell wall biosynthesis
MPDISRDRDLIFLGRLVSDKGVDLLVEALAGLQQRGLTPGLTIVGSGPEEAALRQQAESLQVSAQIQFLGVKQGQELARLLNAHKILVVPSRWQEPFGIVALEGIACGCVVVGSSGGGLKDAIGDCGLTFPNEDVSVLIDHLATLLTQPDRLTHHRSAAVAHLARHTRAAVATAYLKTFETALETAL